MTRTAKERRRAAEAIVDGKSWEFASPSSVLGSEDPGRRSYDYRDYMVDPSATPVSPRRSQLEPSLARGTGAAIHKMVEEAMGVVLRKALGPAPHETEEGRRVHAGIASEEEARRYYAAIRQRQETVDYIRHTVATDPATRATFVVKVREVMGNGDPDNAAIDPALEDAIASDPGIIDQAIGRYLQKEAEHRESDDYASEVQGMRTAMGPDTSEVPAVPTRREAEDKAVAKIEEERVRAIRESTGQIAARIRELEIQRSRDFTAADIKAGKARTLDAQIAKEQENLAKAIRTMQEVQSGSIKADPDVMIRAVEDATNERSQVGFERLAGVGATAPVPMREQLATLTAAERQRMAEAAMLGITSPSAREVDDRPAMFKGHSRGQDPEYMPMIAKNRQDAAAADADLDHLRRMVANLPEGERQSILGSPRATVRHYGPPPGAERVSAEDRMSPRAVSEGDARAAYRRDLPRMEGEGVISRLPEGFAAGPAFGERSRGLRREAREIVERLQPSGVSRATQRERAADEERSAREDIRKRRAGKITEDPAIPPGVDPDEFVRSQVRRMNEDRTPLLP